MATISETSGVGNMPLSSIPLEILWANNHQFRTKGAIFIHAQRHLAGKKQIILLIKTTKNVPWRRKCVCGS
jgi:hypothetical protein